MHKHIIDKLKQKLTSKELATLPRSYDIIGDLLIFAEFPRLSQSKEHLVGNAYLNAHKQIQVVLKKVGKHAGELRKPTYRIIAGKRRKRTIHKENGVSLELHVENTYFSPRTANERMRIIKKVRPKETVLVMFSGVGPIPIELAKHTTATVTGIEKNPEAHLYALRNAQRNKVNVTLLKGDVRTILPTLTTFDRILMPLPKNSADFLDVAIPHLAPKSTIHIYRFCKEGEEEDEAARLRTNIAQERPIISLTWTHCGTFGPRIHRTCFDMAIR